MEKKKKKIKFVVANNNKKAKFYLYCAYYAFSLFSLLFLMIMNRLILSTDKEKREKKKGQNLECGVKGFVT